MANIEEGGPVLEPRQEPRQEPRHEKERQTVSLGGSAIEALAGLTAIVLSILALANMAVLPFTAIAVIATGVALLFEAAAIGARESHGFGTSERTEDAVVRGGIGADAIAGIGAVTLGILSLIGLYPTILLPVSALVVGAGLLLSSVAPMEATTSFGTSRTAEITRQSARAASGVHVLVGAGAVVLGIVGIRGTSPYVLTAIAMLCVGAAELLSGAAIGGRMMNVVRHQH